MMKELHMTSKTGQNCGSSRRVGGVAVNGARLEGHWAHQELRQRLLDHGAHLSKL